jgi:hypothetical protein
MILAAKMKISGALPKNTCGRTLNFNLTEPQEVGLNVFVAIFMILCYTACVETGGFLRAKICEVCAGVPIIDFV